MEFFLIPVIIFLFTMLLSAWLLREIKQQPRFRSLIVLAIVMVYLVILSLGYCAFFIDDVRINDVLVSKLIAASGFFGLLIGTFVPKIQKIFSII